MPIYRYLGGVALLALLACLSAPKAAQAFCVGGFARFSSPISVKVSSTTPAAIKTVLFEVLAEWSKEKVSCTALQFTDGGTFEMTALPFPSSQNQFPADEQGIFFYWVDNAAYWAGNTTLEQQSRYYLALRWNGEAMASYMAFDALEDKGWTPLTSGGINLRGYLTVLVGSALGLEVAHEGADSVMVGDRASGWGSATVPGEDDRNAIRFIFPQTGGGCPDPPVGPHVSCGGAPPPPAADAGGPPPPAADAGGPPPPAGADGGTPGEPSGPFDGGGSPNPGVDAMAGGDPPGGSPDGGDPVSGEPSVNDPTSFPGMNADGGALGFQLGEAQGGCACRVVSGAGRRAAWSLGLLATLIFVGSFLRRSKRS